MKIVSPGLVYIQEDEMIRNLWELEEDMNKFYTSELTGYEITTESLVVGLEVASLYEDTSWYRGEVVTVKDSLGVAEVFFVDHGWSALVKLDKLRILDDKFTILNKQAVPIQISGVASARGKLWSLD